MNNFDPDKLVHTCGLQRDGANLVSSKKDGNTRRKREDRKLEKYYNQTPKGIFNNSNINKYNNTELLDMQAFEDQIY